MTYCHSRTRDLSSVVREADIVVAAVGRLRVIRGEDIKPGGVGPMTIATLPEQTVEAADRQLGV